MRYSVAAAAILIGAASANPAMAGGAVSQIPDGQVQAPAADATAAPVQPAPPVAEHDNSPAGEDSVIYETVVATITSCAPAVVDCPATTKPIITTSVIPVKPHHTRP
ncbi:MAG: hypothetical protein Q9183_003469, partial [Haloplaca sp. 2 TL-2023]